MRRILKVAPPGKGDGESFPTVQAAVDAVPLGNRARVVIRLAPGVYREPVYVAKTKNFITVAGASPEATVVSWDNTATRIRHSQVRRGVCSLLRLPASSSTKCPTGLCACATVAMISRSQGSDFS